MTDPHKVANSLTEALERVKQAVVPSIGNDYAYGKGWNAARQQTLERIDAEVKRILEEQNHDH